MEDFDRHGSCLTAMGFSAVWTFDRVLDKFDKLPCFVLHLPPNHSIFTQRHRFQRHDQTLLWFSWLLLWSHNDKSAPLWRANSLVCDYDIVAIPSHTGSLCLVLWQQPHLPHFTHAWPILFKSLRLSALCRPLLHLQQKRLEHFHESGLNRSHLYFHAHNFYCGDRYSRSDKN